jgi:hypothetical protein
MAESWDDSKQEKSRREVHGCESLKIKVAKRDGSLHLLGSIIIIKRNTPWTWHAWIRNTLPQDHIRLAR